uniref:Reverse transcriptase zinc-binding domain-containing protein n=1 Tax=Chenopodium quinoa TaxID=63459 RepID=A0A803MR69_CHEQI
MASNSLDVVEVEDAEEDEDARVELGLVGKLWTNRNVNVNAFISTMKNVWQPKHGLEIKLNSVSLEAIGNKIGKFIKADSSGSMGIDTFVRLRILIDANKPLHKKGTVLKIVKRVVMMIAHSCLMGMVEGIPLEKTKEMRIMREGKREGDELKPFFGNFAKEMGGCKASMAALMEKDPTLENIARMRAIDERMDELEEREEIRDEARNCYDDEDHIAEVFVKHFDDLFGSSINVETDSVIEKVMPCVSNDMQAMLAEPFKGKESKSLMSRTLKLKYFPNVELMEAKVSANASFTWRSLKSARDLVSKGARKLIGNGYSVEIRKDPWVPTLPNFRVIQRQQQPDENAPVSRYGEDDRWTWDYTKSGDFPVRSVYHAVIEATKNCIASTSSPPHKATWSSLWSANLPPKIKHFKWRVLHKAIPVRFNPKKRGICDDHICPMCGDAPKTIAHKLFFCDATKELCYVSPLRLNFQAENFHSLLSWCKAKENSYFGQIVADILHLSHSCSFFAALHIGRKGNGAAHKLARISKNYLKMRVWIEEIPNDVNSAIVFYSVS